MELSQIPNDGKWKEIAEAANGNFNKVSQAVDEGIAQAAKSASYASGYANAAQQSLNTIQQQIATMQTLATTDPALVAKVASNTAGVAENAADIDTLESEVDGINTRFGDKETEATFSSGYYLNQQGQKVANATAGLMCTDYISVNAGDVVKYKGKGGSANAMICTYDANKNFVACAVAHTGQVVEGQITIASGVKYILAHSTTATDYYCKVDSFGYPALVADVNTIKTEYDATLGNYTNKTKWQDIASNLPFTKYVGTGTRTAQSDGVKFVDGSDGSSNYWVALGIQLPNNFVLGHKYFIALNIQLIEDTTAPTEGSAQGNKTFDSIDLRTNWSTNSIVSATKQTLNAIITKGNTTTLKWMFTIAESSANIGSQIRLQFGSYKDGNSIEYKIKSACVIDMTALGMENASDAEQAFATYGYNHADVVEKIYNIKVKSAETADNGAGGGGASSGAIEIWGDSLVGQGYGTTYLAPMLGRVVISKGYGGKKSPYIRDQFLAQANTANTIIINVGRNNKDCMDEVVQDVRKMVAAIPHNRFLICCPPNGNYGEGKGTTSYTQLDTIRERLRTQYQEHFLDTWGASIQEYDMGGVTLSEAFTKPAVGSQVTIKVSNASFLTTYNSNDVTRWGEDYMKQIVIGQSIDAVDVYKVISANTSANTMVVQLVTSGSTFAVGASVKNGTDDGGTNSVRYLRVLQYADWDCWKKDIGQSTFRADGIHMSNAGMRCLSKIIARKIIVMGI